MSESRRLRVGQYNRLQVIKELEFGIYLDGYEDEILVPRVYVPEGIEIGDYLDVFIYRDSEDRLIGTTLEPKATVGEFAYLKVVDMNSLGAFMDWGLLKDLFVPFRHQKATMAVGKSCLVYLYLDTKTDRILATAKPEKYLDEDVSALKEGQTVELLPFEYTDLGIKALVDGRYEGVIYKSDLFKKVELGKVLPGFIKKIRLDNKLDLALVEQSYNRIEESKQLILDKLTQAGGHLPYTDKTDASVIYINFEMSKKDFKKAVGGLLKDRKIELRDDGMVGV
jgi:uncharacterized protein